MPATSLHQRACEHICYEAARANNWKVVSIRCADHNGAGLGTKTTAAPDEYRLTVFVGDVPHLGEDVATGKGHIYVTMENDIPARITSREYLKALGVEQNPEIFDRSGHVLLDTVGPP